MTIPMNTMPDAGSGYGQDYFSHRCQGNQYIAAPGVPHRLMFHALRGI